MLIQLTIGNFLSFKERVTFSMVAGPIREHPENIIEYDYQKLLKSSIVFGANASGKSNLLKAMGFLRYYILSSFAEFKVESKIPVDSFRLNETTKGKPSYFEIIFVQNGIRYRYGFEVDENKVHSEWLLSAKKNKETTLFTRNNTNQFDVNKKDFKEGEGLQDKTRPNALFVSVVAQFNGEITTQIMRWFNNFIVLTNLDQVRLRALTIGLLKQNEDYKHKITEFIKMADTGIEDFEMKKVETSESDAWIKGIPEDFKKILLSQEFYTVKTLRKRYDKDNNFSAFEDFDMVTKESQGTNKLFDISGPVVDTLLGGKIIVIDELDTSMHPLITQFVIRLFHSSKINPNNAQLIFATHDIKLLDKKFFRRDQIWFAYKDRFGGTELYSLLEYKQGKVRNDASYAKDYMLGKYGAIPMISNQLESLFVEKKHA